jgi:hypothetical protein
MGTSGAYGGSSSAAWDSVRDAWTGLPDGDAAGADNPPDQPPEESGSATSGQDQQNLGSYDELGRALGRALGAGRANSTPPPLSSLLTPRRGGNGGAGGGGGGGAGNGAGGAYTGRSGTRTGRVAAQQAARGGAAVGAAYAYRNRDGAALGQYGISLAELDGLSVRMRCAKLLDLVLGDAGHPDEAVVRRAAAQQVKRILDPSLEAPSAVEAVRDLVGEITMQLGLVELKNQILAGSATADAATKKENGLRSWIRAKLRRLDLGRYGTVSASDCHRAAYRLWQDAQQLIATT